MPGYSKLYDDFEKPRREGKYKGSSLKKHMEKYRHTSGLTEAPIWEQAFSLLDRMLTMDPQKRITAAEAKEHRYFKVFWKSFKENLRRKKFCPQIFKSLKIFFSCSLNQHLQVMSLLDVKYPILEGNFLKMNQRIEIVDLNNRFFFAKIFY